MKEIEYKIITLFRDNPHLELSTSEIINKIDPDFKNLTERISHSDSKEAKETKRSRAKLQRRYLYYFSKLLSEDILQIKKIGFKGEKIYSLNVSEQNRTQDPEKRRSLSSISIAKPVHLSLPIEGLEQSGIIHRLESGTWIDRVNSIIIESEMFENVDEFFRIITEISETINDVIALNNFEVMFRKNSYAQIIFFLRKLHKHCSMYGKRASIIIDVANLNYKQDLVETLKDFLGSNEDELISFIFNVEPKDFHDNNNFFRRIIEFFTHSNLFFKNKTIHPPPFFIGRCGPYTVDRKEWEFYTSNKPSNRLGLINSQATMLVDLKRYFNDEGIGINKLNELMKRITHSFFISNSVQRKNAGEYFDKLIRMDDDNIKRLFMFSKNYIRLWNHKLTNKDIDEKDLLRLYSEAKKKIYDFCIAEETIYKSCGMPTRFRIDLSIASEDYVESFFSEPGSKNLVCSGLKDFYDPSFSSWIANEEDYFNIFSGGFEFKVHRRGDIEPDDIIRELVFLLTTYQIPFIHYTFLLNKEKDLKLNYFVDKK
jgi:hypothetical protein